MGIMMLTLVMVLGFVMLCAIIEKGLDKIADAIRTKK